MLRNLLPLVLLTAVAGCQYPDWTVHDDPAGDAPVLNAKLLGGLLNREISYLPYQGGRRSLVFTPRGVSGPAPAILLLHPGGLALPDAFLNHTQLKAEAAARGWRVIVPQASLLNGWASGTEGTDNDDVGFVVGQLALAQQQDLLDTAQPVFIAGMSSGAMMGYRLLCEVPGRWAAFASVVGVPTRISQQDSSAAYPCEAYEPTPILAINGFADQCVTYDGLQAEGLRDGDRISVPAAFEEFAARNACTDIATETLHGTGWVDRATDCDSGSDVSLVTLERAGHVWPGASTYPTRSRCGGDQVSFPAHQAIADFFAANAARE